MAEQTNNLMQERNGVFDVMPGAEVAPTIAKAVERAKREDRLITFNFSAVHVTVAPESEPEQIRRDMSVRGSSNIKLNITGSAHSLPG